MVERTPYTAEALRDGNHNLYQRAKPIHAVFILMPRVVQDNHELPGQLHAGRPFNRLNQREQQQDGLGIVKRNVMLGDTAWIIKRPGEVEVSERKKSRRSCVTLANDCLMCQRELPSTS